MAQIDKATAQLQAMRTEVGGQTGTWSKFGNVVSGAWAKIGSGLAALEILKFLRQSMVATEQFAVVQAQLKQAVLNTNNAANLSYVSWGAYQKQMNKTVAAESQLSAYSKTDLEGALATLTSTTGSAGEGRSTALAWPATWPGRSTWP